MNRAKSASSKTLSNLQTAEITQNKTQNRRTNCEWIFTAAIQSHYQMLGSNYLKVARLHISIMWPAFQDNIVFYSNRLNFPTSSGTEWPLAC